LLSIDLSQGQVAEAIEAAQAMMRPVQQRLPGALETALVQAVEAWDEGCPEAAHGLLAQSVDRAREMGYL
jgi:hypothetical protein